MSLSQMLLPEFDHEMATTRRVLERVPDDKLDWQPHAKSMSLGRLASHVAELPGWVAKILPQDGFDMAAAPRRTPQVFPSRQELLDAFDRSVASARELIAATDDEAFRKVWTFSRGEQTIFALPRAGVLRTLLFNHVIHHRGQLTVYLRLNDVPVPSVYGPSADESV